MGAMTITDEEDGLARLITSCGLRNKCISHPQVAVSIVNPTILGNTNIPMCKIKCQICPMPTLGYPRGLKG